MSTRGRNCSGLKTSVSGLAPLLAVDLPDPRFHVLILRESIPTNITECLNQCSALVHFLTNYPSSALKGMRLPSPLERESIRGSEKVAMYALQLFTSDAYFRGSLPTALTAL